MARNLTVQAGTLPAEMRGELDRLAASPMPPLLHAALRAARAMDDGLVHAPQNHLYEVLEGLYGWRGQPLAQLEAVNALYAAAVRMASAQAVQTCVVRECLGLATYIAGGGKAEKIGYRIGTLCHSIGELREGALDRAERDAPVRQAA